MEYKNAVLIEIVREFIRNNSVYSFMQYLPRNFKKSFYNTYRLGNINCVLEYIENHLYKYSPTHVLNIFLLAQRRIHFLKKDLFISGNLEFNHFGLIDKSLVDIDLNEKLDVLKFFRIKGKPEDLSFYRNLKRKLELE